MQNDDNITAAGWIVAILAWLVASLGLAQITVPAETPDRHPIVAELNATIPEGATIQGPQWVIPDSVRVIECGPTVLHIWAEPGEHSIAFRAIWLNTKPFTFVDGEGNSRTITEFLGFGQIDEQATFRVLGAPQPDPDPEPEPDPTPPPPGPRWLIWVEESSERTAEQAAVIRSRTLQTYLGQHKHTMLVVDKDQRRADLNPYIDRAGDELPRVFVVAAEGKVLHEGSVPKTAAAAVELLKEHGG